MEVRKTGFFIEISFVFAIGCSFGWIVEVVFRRFWSGKNAEHRWVNPGYLRGPWLPVYGLGLLLLYLLSGLSPYFAAGGLLGRVLLVLMMAVSATVVEYISGVFAKKVLHATLWDYSGEWGNIEGIICPRFAAFWLIACAAYLFVFHAPLRAFIASHAHHPATVLVLGAFLGIFFSDVINTSKRTLKTRKIFKRS